MKKIFKLSGDQIIAHSLFSNMMVRCFRFDILEIFHNHCIYQKLWQMAKGFTANCEAFQTIIDLIKLMLVPLPWLIITTTGKCLIVSTPGPIADTHNTLPSRV